VNVPTVIRIPDSSAWARFAQAGGFEALGAQGGRTAKAWGGTGSSTRLAQRQERIECWRLRPYERAALLIERLQAGETLDQIGRTEGVTKEAVRLWIQPYFEAHGGSVRTLRTEQRRVRAAQQTADRIAGAPLCIVCGEVVLRRRVGRTCSTECSKTFQRFPWRYDETRWRAARAANARYVLSHPEGRKASEIAYAERVLANPDIPANRRYRQLQEDDVARAADHLREFLAAGPRRRKDIVDELRHHGIPEGVLSRIKKKLGVVSRQHGFGPGHWVEWSLPSNADEEAA
jgi:hypothetical protein